MGRSDGGTRRRRTSRLADASCSPREAALRFHGDARRRTHTRDADARITTAGIAQTAGFRIRRGSHGPPSETGQTVSAQLEMETLDRQRERWRQARHELRLADPVDEQFGLGGLGGRVRGLTARVVILPADPFAHRLDFDEDFWKLWMKEIRGPFEGRELRWGSLEAPTPYSAVRCEDGSENAWRRYGALSHSGLLDIGLGEDGGWRGGAK